MKKIWFKAKRYGYGWYPSTWQGWLIMVAYIVVVITAAFATIDTKAKDALHGIGPFLAIDIFATTTLVIVASKFGEKAKWRWGEKNFTNEQHDE